MNQVDVIVVGAGIAGLTAARELRREGKTVLVLEARDRVGGRTMGHTLSNGFVVEMGGQHVGPYQTAVLGLIEDLGLKTSPTYESGVAITMRDGEITRWRFEDGSFGLPEESLAELGRLIEKLEGLAEPVPLDGPWQTPGADELDRQTFATWLDTNTSDREVIQFLESVVAAIFTCHTWEMSLLHILFYLKSNGGFENMASLRGGNQDSRITGGSQLISERIADDLGREAVLLNMPVRGISQYERGVRVRTDHGEFSAQRAVVTLPPALAGRLDYQPPMPPLRDALTQQVPMGSVIKIMIAYETPFWRDQGLSGFTETYDGPLEYTIDSSPDDGSFGVLSGFIAGRYARTLGTLPADERRTIVLDYLSNCFGPRAAQPDEYVEQDWSAEEYTRGCYGGHLGAGVWTQFGKALAEPVGRIHWAGTETSQVSNGYMDGAVRSGKRAAAEVLAKLSQATPSVAAPVPGR